MRASDPFITRLTDNECITYIYVQFVYETWGERKMALNIRNTKAETLARELAAESGETITLGITHALEERLERFRGRSTATDLVEIGLSA